MLLSCFLSYRDLKPENILYQSPADDAPLKIADFGLATLIRPNQLMTVACGTPGYVAPEILRGIAYGREVDIWSIGVILYILLCGFPPFYDDNNKKLFAQIVNARYSFPDPYWTNISPLAKDLVSKLLVIDPKKRLTCDEILRHSWMLEDGRNMSLDHFRPNMKSFNARRRFRSAIRAVQLTQLLHRTARSSKGAVNTENPSLLDVVENTDSVGRTNSILSVDLPSETSFQKPVSTEGETENTSFQSSRAESDSQQLPPKTVAKSIETPTPANESNANTSVPTATAIGSETPSQIAVKVS
jgi:serine/threonine protein kinase